MPEHIHIPTTVDFTAFCIHWHTSKCTVLPHVLPHVYGIKSPGSLRGSVCIIWIENGPFLDHRQGHCLPE